MPDQHFVFVKADSEYLPKVPENLSVGDADFSCPLMKVWDGRTDSTSVWNRTLTYKEMAFLAYGELDHPDRFVSRFGLWLMTLAYRWHSPVLMRLSWLWGKIVKDGTASFPF